MSNEKYERKIDKIGWQLKLFYYKNMQNMNMNMCQWFQMLTLSM